MAGPEPWTRRLDDDGADAVALSTIHRAKGLEFAHVAAIGWAEGQLPHYTSTHPSELAEEQRLAYVALTRAESTLLITWSRGRNDPRYPDRAPIRFLAPVQAEIARLEAADAPLTGDARRARLAAIRRELEAAAVASAPVGADRRAELTDIVGAGHCAFAPDLSPDDLHDESLHPPRHLPCAVVRPGCTDEVAAIARCAAREGLRSSRAGRAPASRARPTPVEGGLVVAFDRMNRVLQVDADDHVAVVQPGVTLRELDAALAGTRAALPGLPRRALGVPRRQRQHQRRRDARGAPRRDATPRPRPRARAGRRHGRAHRGAGRQVLDGLRPHPAGHRVARAPWPW